MNVYELAWGWALIVAQTTSTSSVSELVQPVEATTSSVSELVQPVEATTSSAGLGRGGVVATSSVAERVHPSGSVTSSVSEGFQIYEGRATKPSAGRTVSSSELRTSKRLVPNYDGRVAEGVSAKDVLLWVPRVVLSPVHLVTEWVIRRPIGALLTVAERDNWSSFLIDFLTFDDRKIGVIPTVFYDFNFRPSVGVYIFWNELFVPMHSVRLTAGYGGEDWYRITFSDRWDLAERLRLSFNFNLWGRPDYIYAGEGIDSDPDARTRYFSEYIDGVAQLEVRPWRRSRVLVEAGVRQYSFDADGAAGEGEQTLARALENGVFRNVSGGLDDYFLNFQRILLEFDTRRSRPAPTSGIRLAPYLSMGWDMRDPDERAWMGYGGSITGFWDVGHHRVWSLSSQIHLVDPLGDRSDFSIPFTELFELGRRPQDLSGFLPGVLRGQSAAVFTVGYSYPIWVFLDGALNVSMGNAFDRSFEGFDVSRFRASIGLGIESQQDEDNSFTLMFAIGTSRFDESFAIDSFRFVVGTQTGF